MRFSANQRLRKAGDFQEVRKGGVRINCGCFIANVLKNLLGIRRFGVIASTKVGNAVRRNRAKRVFREIFRLNQELLPESVDIVIVVRNNFEDYSYKDLTERFVRLCENLKNQ
ncbi:MAG: ribonuclease P protein component [Verrucomicrobia bacterium]|nr:MAG: ribonuclease P protein component [Verrucomicrobiota bacterium]